jgi:hypothetical protein
MENIENIEQVDNSFVSNKEINDYLLETAKWGKFLAIVGYVGMGILILVAIFMMFGLSRLSKFSGTPFPMGLFGVIYILLAIIYYFPVTYMFNFSVRMKQGLSSNDLQSVISGFENLKSVFKFMGIFTIVVLSIYGLVLIIAIPTALLFLK